MRYGNFLNENVKIGFVAPSFGATTEPYATCFKYAINFFNDKGYKTIIGENCYKDFGVGKSNTAKSCGDEINDFFINDKADFIISCGGGETMCEDLNYIDFDKIKNARPKFFMGFSDNTNLTFTLATICDIASIYGPNAASFGQENLHESLLNTYSLMLGQKLNFQNYDKWELVSEKDETNPRATFNTTEKSSIKTFFQNNRTTCSLNDFDINETKDKIEFNGRLLGGCLDSLNILCGTKFDKVKEFNEKYKDDGIIWFLESCELNPMGIFRVLWQLDNAGWFKYTRGFLIGRPMVYGTEIFNLDSYKAVLSVLSKYKVPIIMDLDIGHLPPMIPLITGAMANVNVRDNQFNINMKLI